MSQKKEPARKRSHDVDTTQSRKHRPSAPTPDPSVESREPAEGRNDIAEDLAQEERQSYSAHHPIHHPKKGEK